MKKGTIAIILLFLAAVGLVLPGDGHAGPIIRQNGGSAASSLSDTVACTGSAINFDGGTLYVDCSGNTVGVGTTSPATGSVFTSSGAVVIQSTSGTAGHQYFQLRDNTGAVDAVFTQEGRLGIGTSAPGTNLLETYGPATAAGSNAIAIRGAQANHGMTNLLPTDAAGVINRHSSTTGGLDIVGGSNAGSQSGLYLDGYVGSATMSAGIPALSMRCGKANGANLQALGSTDTCWTVRDFTTNTPLIAVLGGGNVGIGATSPESKLEVNGGVSAPVLTLQSTVSGDNVLLSSITVKAHDQSGNTQTWGGIRFISLEGTDTLEQTDIAFVGYSAGTLAERLRIAGGNVGIGTSSPATKLHVSSGTLLIDGNVVGVRVNPLAAQTISAGSTIAADSCGGAKLIGSGGAVTTDTTNTFTAPGATNNGCCMDVINTGSNNITLDNNALFFSAGAADVVLGSGDTARVCSDGSAWYQIGATGNN